MRVKRLKYYPDLYQLVLLYMDDDFKRRQGSMHSQYLAGQFKWSKTLEGRNFWSYINSGRIPLSHLGLFESVDNRYRNPLVGHNPATRIC